MYVIIIIDENNIKIINKLTQTDILIFKQRI